MYDYVKDVLPGKLKYSNSLGMQPVCDRVGPPLCISLGFVLCDSNTCLQKHGLLKRAMLLLCRYRILTSFLRAFWLCDALVATTLVFQGHASCLQVTSMPHRPIYVLLGIHLVSLLQYRVQLMQSSFPVLFSNSCCCCGEVRTF